MVRLCRRPTLSYSFAGEDAEMKIARLACTVCDHYIMGSSTYVVILGLIGTVATVFDVVNTMNYKLTRCPSRFRNNELVPHNVRRDLKLMSSILAIEHYGLITLGAITEYPMLHTPWLVMQLCIFIMEIIVFFVSLFLDGLHIKRNNVILAAFMIYNWLQVFCLFHWQARQ